jgi:hypothetical protein
VTAAAIGADHVLRTFFSLQAFESAVVLFAAILSFFATFVAVNLPLVWRIVLWPVNFCVLVYLVISSSFFIDTVAKSRPDKAPGVSNVINQQILPGSGGGGVTR